MYPCFINHLFLSRDRCHFFGIEASIWQFGYSQQQMENENNVKMTATLLVIVKMCSHFVRNNFLRMAKHHYFCLV